MADDTPETPTTDSAPEAAAPTPRRRASPRKASAKGAPREPKAPSKGVVTRAEEAVSRTATAVRDTVVDAEERVVRAVKPRSTKRAPARADAAKRNTGTTAPAKEPPAKRTAAKTGRGATKSTVARTTEAVGGRWATVAIAGVAAAGATAAALLTLRGSSGRNLGTTKKPIDITGSGDKGPGHGVDVHGTAHHPDGTDSTKSFQAGIADENTVPD